MLGSVGAVRRPSDGASYLTRCGVEAIDTITLYNGVGHNDIVIRILEANTNFILIGMYPSFDFEALVTRQSQGTSLRFL